MDALDLPEARLAIALGVGLVIGAERERHKGDGPRRAAAGIRTFALVALFGGVLAAIGGEVLLVAGAAIVGGLAIAAYRLGDREDPGFTSEVALVLAYALGALAGREPRLALAAGITVATVLALRAPLHRISRTVVTDDELRDALLFAVAAVVILPLLPDRAIGPFGLVNPFTLWRLVVVLMATSGAGYLAQRILGPRYGLALAGLGGGFVSSSATIAAMGGRARADAGVLVPAVAGAAASTVATFVQLAILIGTANPPLLAMLAWPLGAGGVTALGFAGYYTLRASRRATADATPGRAFRLSSALLFGGLVTAIGLASTAARAWLGTPGAVVTAAVAGFADAHSSTAAIAAMAATSQLDGATAELAIVLALATNTITKVVLAISSGPRAFSVRVIVGLALAVAATAAGFALAQL